MAVTLTRSITKRNGTVSFLSSPGRYMNPNKGRLSAAEVGLPAVVAFDRSRDCNAGAARGVGKGRRIR
jgi:hypothetical protein